MPWPGVSTANDSVKDNVRSIPASRPFKTLRITAVMRGSVRNGNLGTIAPAPIGFRPKFSGSFHTKYLSAVVCDPASAVGHDGVAGAVNLE